MSLVYADGCKIRVFSNPEAPIDISGRLVFVTLAAPAAMLALVWSMETWRRVVAARSTHLARSARDLEQRLDHARGELREWERRALTAAAALADVSAQLAWNVGEAERQIARLADNLRTSLRLDVTRPLRVVPAARTPATPRRHSRVAAILRERSA